jgi:hypothetical protein
MESVGDGGMDGEKSETAEGSEEVRYVSVEFPLRFPSHDFDVSILVFD